jgi:hypothetical protein
VPQGGGEGGERRDSLHLGDGHTPKGRSTRAGITRRWAHASILHSHVKVNKHSLQTRGGGRLVHDGWVGAGGGGDKAHTGSTGTGIIASMTTHEGVCS